MTDFALKRPPPSVDKGEWIRIGPESALVKRMAVVCMPGEDLEAVFVDAEDNVLNVRLRWMGDLWQVAGAGRSEDPENDAFFAPYVKLLLSKHPDRAGRAKAKPAKAKPAKAKPAKARSARRSDAADRIRRGSSAGPRRR